MSPATRPPLSFGNAVSNANTQQTRPVLTFGSKIPKSNYTPSTPLKFDDSYRSSTTSIWNFGTDLLSTGREVAGKVYSGRGGNSATDYGNGNYGPTVSNRGEVVSAAIDGSAPYAGSLRDEAARTLADIGAGPAQPAVFNIDVPQQSMLPLILIGGVVLAGAAYMATKK